MADQIRAELATLLTREVHDPGIGFMTITRVRVSPDLQMARVMYTVLGDDRARAENSRALERARPFLRRQIGARLRLRRAPDLTFVYDEAVAGQDRVEQLLNEIREQDAQRPRDRDAERPGDDATPDRSDDDA